MVKSQRHKRKGAAYASEDSPAVLIAIAAILLSVTSAVYWQVRNYEFINLDDPKYITENGRVQSGLSWENVKWAFTTRHASNWHPLTWLSHILDCQTFGLNSGWHHLVNLLFHLLNTLLLLLVLYRMTRAVWPSAFVAALFALHPLHTESVAWVAERKDVLGMFFLLLTLWGYSRYVERPCFIRYVTLMVFLAMGLMAKPMLVTVPFVLLLLDYWPLRRFGNNILIKPAGTTQAKRSTFLYLLLEKAPLFVLAVICGVITLQAQQEITVSLQSLDLHSRIANSLVSYVAYLRMMIWPTRLAVFYAHTRAVPMWQEAAAAALLAAATVFAVLCRRNYRYIPVGWLWYLGTLVPVIGLVQVGTQRYADRYTYIPLAGIFIIIAWGVPDILKGIHYRKLILAVSATTVLLVLAACSWLQAGYWRNNITLYEHALEVTENNHLAHNNLGVALKQQGKINEAIIHWRLALDIFPAYGDAIANLAPELVERRRPDEAIKYCTEFLQKGRDHCEVRNNLGNAYRAKGELDEAIKHYQGALVLKPDAWQVHYNLGLVLAEKQQFAEAVKHFQEALRAAPNNAVIIKALSDAENKQTPTK